MIKMDCIFCKIIKGEIPSYKIYEDDFVLGFLDINPSTNGDLLLIPKNHVETILDLDSNVWLHLQEVVKKLYPTLKERLACSGLTLVQNNEYGQDVKHFHLHVTPRYKDDELTHTFNKQKLLPLEEVNNKLKNSK